MKKEIAKIYRNRFNEQDIKKKNLLWYILCKHFLNKYIQQNDVVLDIACGFGEFANNIQAKKIFAVDLNADSKSFLNKKITFFNKNFLQLNSIKKNSIDVCFSSNFFEHLSDKRSMDAVLIKAYELLKPGGLYICIQPNIRYEQKKYWDFYDHNIPLSHLSCSEAFLKNGFLIEKLIPKFLPFSTKDNLPQSQLLLWIYLKIPFLWIFFGKQFFLIAKKP